MDDEADLTIGNVFAAFSGKGQSYPAKMGLLAERDQIFVRANRVDRVRQVQDEMELRWQ